MKYLELTIRIGMIVIQICFLFFIIIPAMSHQEWLKAIAYSILGMWLTTRQPEEN